MLVAEACQLAPVGVALGQVALEGGPDGGVQPLCRLGGLVGADGVAARALCLECGIHLGKLREPAELKGAREFQVAPTDNSASPEA